MAKYASEGGTGGERSKREEREQRILDVTIELLQTWGYRKTTLEDIAHAAGVAKGTIYLYWPTRDKLFMAIIEREQMRLIESIMQRMEEDPEGMTLIGLIKHSIQATMENPVARALILQDTDFLGKLMIREINAANYEAQLNAYMTLIQVLRSYGLIRSDIELQEQVLSTTAASWGPLLLNQILPAKNRLSDQQTVALIVLALKRLLEPDIPPTEEQRQAGEQTLRAYLQHLIANPFEE